jgi:hypothetical protein
MPLHYAVQCLQVELYLFISQTYFTAFTKDPNAPLISYYRQKAVRSGPPNISLCVQLLLFQKRDRHSLTSQSMTEIRSLESPPPSPSPPPIRLLFSGLVSWWSLYIHNPYPICKIARLFHPKVPFRECVTR